MSRALVFPGQGSQYLTMGKALSEVYEPARLVFEEINDALSQDLSKIMWEGPEGDLKLTENTQPALMAHSMAIIRTLEDGGKPVSDIASHVAGHSLGEYTALCAAGAFSLADTARLLKRRGQAMQRAVPVGEGAMAAILGMEMDAVRAICEQASSHGVVVPANDNGGGQVVISGETKAVEAAAEAAKAAGAKRALMLPVSAPFHCPLMAPAAEEMKEAFAEVTIKRPVLPVIANVIAAPVTEPEGIVKLLVEQVTGSVRWQESVASFASLGITDVAEIGAGKALCGMIRRIDRSLAFTNVQDPEQLESFAKTL